VLTVEEIKNYIEVIDPLTQQIIIKPDLASTFKLEPDGFVFAKPLNLALKYNIAALRDKFTENDLTIRHNGHKVETTLDTYQQIVSGEINHFSSVTISTYSGKCTEEKVGKFNSSSPTPIKYFNCENTWAYPWMHVAVADRAALATTYELKVLAAHNSGETFRTQTVQHLVDEHFPDAVVAINGTTFNCKEGDGEACYAKNMDGSYPVYTTATDRRLNQLVTNPCVDGSKDNCTPEVALAFGGDNQDRIPIQYLTHNSKLLDKENKDKELYLYETVFQKSFGMSIGEVDIEKDRAMNGTAMASMIGTHTGIRFGNICRVSGDTGQGKEGIFIDTEASLFGYGQDKIIFLSSHYSPNIIDRPFCTFDTFEDMCEAVRLFGITDAVSLDGGPSVQLVVDRNLKNIQSPSDARHVVNAVGLVCNNPDMSKGSTPDPDGKYRIIHSTKYRCEDNLCWSPSWKPNFENLAKGTLSCWDADKWFEIKDGNICGNKTERDRSICAEVYKNSSNDGETGDNSTSTGGSYTPPKPDDQPVPGLPDFIINKVTLANESGSKEKYRWKINETAYVHSWTDNIGDANWQGSADKIKVPFYLSKGIHEDSHSEWKRIDRMEIKRDKLKVNQPPKHEYIKFKLQDYANDGTVMPGRTYNFVVCADRPHDEDNGDGDVQEKHKSNNCSTEAVFYVDYGPPRNVDLTASNLALTGGRTLLQAGEKYGLQVVISNIGTEPPWNGFLTSYEIKGPGTGNVWQRISQDSSQASSLYQNATHSESMSSEQEVNAPMVGGDYVFRTCADYTQAVPETNESNNCTAELPVYVAPPPMPDLITEGLQLTHGRTSLIAGELYGLTVNVRNIGNATPSSYSYTKYEIKGPGTSDQWQKVAEDGTMAEHLEPGMTHWEEISDDEGLHIPAVPGTYTARACADYKGNIPESDEGNNCSEITFEVEPVPAGSPRIVITNPTSDDDWRSSETDHDVRWDYFDFPVQGNVRVEYSLDGGATWLLIDDETTNDGKKHWEDMCDYHTVDTHHAYIRVTSLEYPYVYDVSDEFTIDHAAECE
ncbi:MAG: CARDB protein, partial [Candidatus Electronema aureum]